MANKQKKTQKEWYVEIIELLEAIGGHTDKVDFLKDRVEKLDKKSSSKKETEQQKNRLRLAQAVYDYMVENVEYTITDLIKEVPALQELETISNQYVTSIVGVLKDNGLVNRVIDKGRAKFVKVETETEVGEE